jgi:hypothetical protein
MDKKEEIQQLRQRIKELESQIEESDKDKYLYLVGKYLRRGHNSYEKITSINRIDYNDSVIEIHFNSIEIFWDDRGDEYNSKCYISLNQYGSITDEIIDKYLIDENRFKYAFDSAVDCIKRITL